jgi:hypothetical protein
VGNVNREVPSLHRHRSLCLAAGIPEPPKVPGQVKRV